MVVEKNGVQGFTNEDLVLLSLLAAQVAVLLENRRCTMPSTRGSESGIAAT